MQNKNMAIEAKLKKCAYQLQKYLISSFEDTKSYEEFVGTYITLTSDERKQVSDDTIVFLLKAGFENMIPQATSILNTYGNLTTEFVR